MDFFHKKFFSLCNVLNHKGETLKNIIYRYVQSNGMSLSALAKLAGYDQSTPYRHFEREDLPDHIIIRWGKAMSYDMTRDFPHLVNAMDMVSDTDREPYKTAGKHDLDYWKEKYMTLLERYNLLLEDKLCEAKTQ